MRNGQGKLRHWVEPTLAQNLNQLTPNCNIWNRARISHCISVLWPCEKSNGRRFKRQPWTFHRYGTKRGNYCNRLTVERNIFDKNKECFRAFKSNNGKSGIFAGPAVAAVVHHPVHQIHWLVRRRIEQETPFYLFKASKVEIITLWPLLIFFWLHLVRPNIACS